MAPRHPKDEWPGPEEDAAGEERPSKSSRKRAAHAAQALGERLIGLREQDLAALKLPDQLADAIREARRIRARGGLARQRQYIGKLMREIDTAPIEAALAGDARDAALQAERFRRVEAWRDRLVLEGEPALQALAEWRPDVDRSALERAVAKARTAPPGSDARARAARELFRLLRSSIDREDESSPVLG